MKRIVDEGIDGPNPNLPSLPKLPLRAHKTCYSHLQTSKILIANYEKFGDSDKDMFVESLVNTLERFFLSYLKETMINKNSFPPSINNRRFIKFLKESTSRED